METVTWLVLVQVQNTPEFSSLTLEDSGRERVKLYLYPTSGKGVTRVLV